MSFIRLIPLSLITAVTLCAGAAVASDLLEEGEKYYAAGQYAQAANLLHSYAISNPEDPTAQYYLANCYVELKRTDDALQHYSQVTRLAPKSKISEYSRTEIGRIQALNYASVTSEQAPKNSAASPYSASQQSSASQSVEAKAVVDTNAQTDESEKNVQAEYDAKIAQVKADSQSQLQRLMDEQTNRILELGDARRAKGYVYRPDTGPIRAEIKERAAVINAQTARKIDELNVECKTKLATLEEFAVNANRSYINHEQNSNVRSSALHQ